MTTTNNNREYAVSLDYEVREADNSINCKTAYKVFDNMQDAVNYAIDFIANNPDANIRLTNELFNGSQISVYGDGSAKYYDLTDADINAVRNVEVNAVNTKADEITLDGILNDDEVSEHFQPVTVYVENQYGREVLVADGKVITEEEYYAMCIENCFNELRSMIKFYYKHHGLTLAQTEQIFMAIYIDEGNLDHDAIEQMIRDFKAANNPDDEPPTPPTPPTDRRAESENANAAEFGLEGGKVDTDIFGHRVYKITVNDEEITFKNGSIVRIDAVNKYGMYMKRTNAGNKVFYYKSEPHDRRIAVKDLIADCMEQEQRRAERAESYRRYLASKTAEELKPSSKEIVIRKFHVSIAYRTPEDNYKELYSVADLADTAADAANSAIKFIAEHPEYTILDISRISNDIEGGTYLITEADINAINELAAESTTPVTVNDDEDTVFAAYEAAINVDRAYVLKAQELFTAHADGDTLRSFQLAYAQDRKQYGENISQALRALSDNRSEGYNEKLQSLIDTWDAESDKVLTVNKTIFNQRLIEALIQKFDESENAQAVNEPATPTVEPADYTPQVAEWIDPHQYGEHGNLEQPRDISVYCNDDTPNIKHRFLVDIYFENTATRNCIIKSSFHANSCDAANFIINFAAKHPNRKILDVKIRDFENIYTSYQLSEADFYALYPFVEDDFAREYAQAAEATKRIRQIDPDAEIIFAADEPAAERFVLTTADNSCANCATAAEAEDLFYQLQADKQYTPVDTEHHVETIWYRAGKWVHVASDKYGADIYRNGLTGEPEFVIRYGDDDKRFVTEEEFFAEMVKRGA